MASGSDLDIASCSTVRENTAEPAAKKARKETDDVYAKLDSDEMSLKDFVFIIKTEMEGMAERMEKKMERLEERIAGTIVKQVTKDLSKQIKDSVEKAVKDKVGALKKEVMKEIDDLKENVQAAKPNEQDRRLNFVLYNYQESENENIVNKVNSMIKEGLKLTIEVKSCYRIPSRGFNKSPGVIIATCKNTQDKEAIMKAKTTLRESRNYRDVKISHDYSIEARQMSSNMRIIMQELGEDKFELRGSRLLRKTYLPDHNQQRRDHPEQDHRRRTAPHEHRDNHNRFQNNREPQQHRNSQPRDMEWRQNQINEVSPPRVGGGGVRTRGGGVGGGRK